jgi:hypothetical protein
MLEKPSNEQWFYFFTLRIQFRRNDVYVGLSGDDATLLEIVWKKEDYWINIAHDFYKKTQLRNCTGAVAGEQHESAKLKWFSALTYLLTELSPS